jgi:hypothetical protein
LKKLLAISLEGNKKIEMKKSYTPSDAQKEVRLDATRSAQKKSV